METYLGRCHCGALRFTLECEAITAGLRCNCSICVRKGAVMSTRYFGPGEIEIEGRDALTLYVWGDRMVNNWFCRVCGIYTFNEVIEKPGHYRINLGCVEGIDPLSLPIELVDGRSF